MARCKYMKVADARRAGLNQFPNFSASGSIKGMKKLYYGEDALLIRSGSFIYYVGNLRRNRGSLMSRGENLYFNYAY